MDEPRKESALYRAPHRVSKRLGGSRERRSIRWKMVASSGFRSTEGKLSTVYESLEELTDTVASRAGAKGEVTALLEEAFDAAGEEFLIDLD